MDPEKRNADTIRRPKEQPATADYLACAGLFKMQCAIEAFAQEDIKQSAHRDAGPTILDPNCRDGAGVSAFRKLHAETKGSERQNPSRNHRKADHRHDNRRYRRITGQSQAPP